MTRKRGSGILLHITSLPSPFGVGDLGPGAYQFADFLSQTRQLYWQILPINPTSEICGNSPYSSTSAFAGNTLLISPQLLQEEGFLTGKDLEPLPNFPADHCRYREAIEYKERILKRAYEQFIKKGYPRGEFDSFCQTHTAWLDDFALFEVIRRHHKGKPWNTWQAPLRDRSEKALKEAALRHHAELEQVKFFQYLFFKQWMLLKKYCNQKGIHIIGDLPIYVSFDSADVWKHPTIFKLTKKKDPRFVAGVPPDYFSKTGQLWGNPVYDWRMLKKSNYAWWIERLGHNLACFDSVRIDHFRGLVAYWQVPAGEPTAVNGHWEDVPVKDFFRTLSKHFPVLPVIAEDLGLITPDVRQVLADLGFPGMKVLIFAFAEENPLHPYLPHVCTENFIIYTGTHDNNTVRGWFEQEASDQDKNRFFRYLGRTVEASEVNWECLRLAMISVAFASIFPLQDVLGLPASCRMNTPSTPTGNWQWRYVPEQLTEEVRGRFAEMTYTYGRSL